jgi:hypothetical protein
MTVQVEVTTTEVGTTEQVTTVVEVAAIGPELVQIATAGPQGPQGIQGIQGPQGEPGQGILPNGGDTGEILVKLSDDDQDAGWTDDYATSAQGALADSAIQPLDNVSELTNDANYIDASGAPVQSVDGQTGAVDLSGEYDALGSASSVQGNLDTHTSATTSVHGIADTSQLIVEGDSRLSDQRVPTDNSVTSAKIASGGISPASVTGTAVITSDARLSDERTPVDGSVTDAKVSASADIAQSKIAGLTSALDGKANLVDGKVPTSELPALAITSTFVVADITARNALTVQEGDVAIVQDTGSGEPASYIYDGTNWQELLTPTDGVTAVTASEGLASSGGTTPNITIVNGGVTDAKLAGSISPSKITGTAVVDGDARLSEGASTAETVRSLGTGATQALPGDYDVAGQAPVQSVASKTGDVTLTKSDVGLGNVDNTSDLEKPISTATQTALNGKADETTTITAGTGLTGGGDLSQNRTIDLDASTISSLELADSALQSGDPATDIAYDNTTSGLTATTVQEAIDELAALLQSALVTE